MTWWHFYLITGCATLQYTEYCLMKYSSNFLERSRFALVVGYLLIFAAWPVLLIAAAVLLVRSC